MKILGWEPKRWQIAVILALFGLGLALRYNLFGKYAMKEGENGARQSAEYVPGILDNYVIKPLQGFADNGWKIAMSARDELYATKMGQPLYDVTSWWVRAMRPIADMAASAIDFIRQPFVKMLNKDGKVVPLVQRDGWYEVAGFAAAAAIIGGFFGIYKTLFPHGLGRGYNALKSNKSTYGNLVDKR